MMAVKSLLTLVPLLLTSLTGVCSQRPSEIYAKAGEMVALLCPYYRGYTPCDANLVWTSYATREMDLTNNMSSAELNQMGMVVHGRDLVILNASVIHEGNYSCSLGNVSSQFRLTVTQTREFDERTTYSAKCYTQESCRLYCPDVNTPSADIPNITSSGIIWHKQGESTPITGFFRRVEEKDRGVYTCTRSYLYHGQMYNMSFAMVLDVKPSKKTVRPMILSPHGNEVFHVDLGSTVVIDCKAVLSSKFDEVFWLSGQSFVETNVNLAVFYNYTREYNTEDMKMTASLVFKKVSEEDLSKNYTCKLETTYGSSSFVTVTLAQNASAFSLSLALGIVIIVVLIIVTVVVYVKLKMDIALFLRDVLGCYRSTSDGKSYDAFWMSYKSNADAGLNEHNQTQLKSVLEERFGYSLCLYDRDVSPEKNVAEAVLDCIEQSRTVVMVPTSSDPGPGSGLLNDIRQALVGRQTRLVFIKTKATEVSRSSSLPEALQLLCETGDCVTWKGKSSMKPSSSFWKRLRYYLPAPQRVPKTPQTIQNDICYNIEQSWNQDLNVFDI